MGYIPGIIGVTMIVFLCANKNINVPVLKPDRDNRDWFAVRSSDEHATQYRGRLHYMIGGGH
jgi:hypothetical protein